MVREHKGVEFFDEAFEVGILFAFADADTELRLDLLATTTTVFSHLVHILRRTHWRSAFAHFEGG